MKWEGKTLRWAGKDFRGVDDVDPIMVLDEEGKRSWSEEWGHASVSRFPLTCFAVVRMVVWCVSGGATTDVRQLREMVFRGVASVAMIYDTKPIFDHFRYVDEDNVMGAMDAPKVMGDNGTFYFYLSKRKGEKSE